MRECNKSTSEIRRDIVAANEVLSLLKKRGFAGPECAHVLAAALAVGMCLDGSRAGPVPPDIHEAFSAMVNAFKAFVEPTPLPMLHS